MTLISLVLPLALLQGQVLPPNVVPPKPTQDKVLAKVDGTEIKASDIDALLWDWRAREVVDDLIVYQQIAAEAKKANVSVSEAEIENAVNDNIDRYKQSLQPGQDLEDALRVQGMPRSRIYLRSKVEKLLEKIAEADFKPESLVKVSTLVVKPRSESASDVADAIKKADLAYQRLGAGEKWDQVLASLSDDPNLLRNNGFLGWRSLDAFPPSTRQELPALKAGAFTKPVQTPNGIQIFRVDMQGKDAKGEELETLKNSYLAGARQRVLERIRSQSKVEKFH